MEGKVITEFKVIEMEDGYRIEIKGDKERLKKMFEHRGQGFGPGMGFGPWGRRHRGFGPFGFFRHGPWGWGHHGPWGWGDEEEESQPGPSARA
jgi:hypothetical protein